MRFEVYTDHAGEFRWRCLTENHRIIADSSESYKNKADCLNGIRLLRDGIIGGAVVFINGTAVDL